MPDPTTIQERIPAYPFNPDYYRGRPDTDGEKAYFINRGAVYQDGRYVGGFAVPHVRPIAAPDGNE